MTTTDTAGWVMPTVERIMDGADGPVIGLHLSGHHDDETALALAVHFAEDEGWYPRRGLTVDRSYVTNVQMDDEDGEDGDYWQYLYAKAPAPRFRAVTVVEEARRRLGTCLLCPWDAAIIFHPDIALCRAHGRSYYTLQAASRAENGRRCDNCGHHMASHPLPVGWVWGPGGAPGRPPAQTTCLGAHYWAPTDCPCTAQHAVAPPTLDDVRRHAGCVA